MASASRLFHAQPKALPAPVVAIKEKKVEDVKEGDGLNFFQRLQPGCAAAAQAVQSQFHEQAGKALRQSLSVFANIRGKQREATTNEHELAAVPATVQGGQRGLDLHSLRMAVVFLSGLVESRNNGVTAKISEVCEERRGHGAMTYKVRTVVSHCFPLFE